MKRTLLPLFLTVLVATGARAQSLRLDIALECESYVVCELVPLTLRISNVGVTPFIADDYGAYQENTVSIVLRHESDGYQEQAREGMPFGAVMVAAQQAQTYQCNLHDWFPALRQGKYTVQVFARRGAETISSRLAVFSVVKGLEISVETHMLPGSDTRARRYTLLYWPRKQREDLFLKVEDLPGEQVVALFRLGNVVRYFKPRLEFSEDGRMSVLHQIARDRYVRTVFQSDASALKVLERSQLVDPGQAVLERSVLESRRRDLETGSRPVEFRRRKRPSAEDKEEEKKPDAGDAAP